MTERTNIQSDWDKATKKFIWRNNAIRVLENPGLHKFWSFHMRRTSGLVQWFKSHLSVLQAAWRLPISFHNRGFHLKVNDPNPRMREREIPARPKQKRPVPTSSQATRSSPSGGDGMAEPPIPEGARATKYPKVQRDWVYKTNRDEDSADFMDETEGTSTTKPCQALCPECLDVDRMSYCILSLEPYHGRDHRCAICHSVDGDPYHDAATAKKMP